MNSHKERVKEALEAINAVFSDTSVSKEKTLESLEEVRDEVDAIIGLLKDELR